MTVTLAGPLSNDGGLTNGTKVTNLSQADLNANSTDAVNGAQLFSTNTNLNNVGLNTANHLGGGATYDPSTGAISSPSYNVYGTNYNNVGTALGALQSSAPIQYSDNNGVPTPGTVSNDTVLVGSTNAPVTLHNVAAGTAATDAVNVSQLQALDGDAVKYDPLSLKMTVTLGGPLSNNGGATGGTRITNLSQANLSANSTDAVNGAQLFSTNTHIDAIGVNTANHLGGGATYDPSTGIISTPSYSVYGANYNSVGTAIGALQSSAPVQYSDSNGVPTPNTVSNDVTLVGSTNTPVTLHNVAAGTAATDAVNVSQLQAVSNDVSTLDSLAVKYSDPTKALISLGGPTSIDGGITGGTLITNLQQGQVSATSTDAVNGAQLFNLGAGLTSNIDALGNSTANNFGGGAVYNPLTGIISAPSYSVFGTNYTNVGNAISALQSSAPLQYSDNNGVITPNTVTNDVTLQGSGGGPVTIHNVAAGSSPNDAVNVSQLNAVANNVSNLDSLAVKYADATKALITLGGATSTDGGVTGGTLITNLQQGQISANSTDAVNGAQLYTTIDMINHINNSSAIKYFNVNSTLGDSNALGANSMSIGPLANATGANSIAMGVNSLASDSGAVAIGQNSQATNVGAIAVGQNAAATGAGSIAIGTGALATGSVAVGTGAQAGSGGAAFGDNAVALMPNQGTAIGNGATVTANRGVALGAGATATRAGMNGATERYSNVPVTSTEGAVSVGSVNNERQITNVAGGTAATDAVNVRQLDAAMAQTSIDIGNQLDNLRSDLIAFKDDANAGTAAAMAIASMPQSVIPGKVLVAAGIANYQGQSAVSIGVSNFSENGRWILNLNGSANTRGNAGAAVGIGFHW
jgi:autotransporter adhesin